MFRSPCLAIRTMALCPCSSLPSSAPHSPGSYPDPEPLLIPVGQVTEWKFMGLTGHPVHLQ